MRFPASIATTLTLALALASASSAEGAAGAPGAPRLLLWQTNSDGREVDVFDVAARRRVARIEVGPQPHGIAATSDGRTVFVSVEANGRPHGELLWIDARTFRVTRRRTVGPEPHHIAVSSDDRFVYVPCRDGTYWVVEAATRRVAARIRTGGRPHNSSAAKRGGAVLLSPMGAPRRAIWVDAFARNRVRGEVPFSDSLRPPALSADGRRLFQHVDGLNGFEVADVEGGRLVARVEHSGRLGWFLAHPQLGWLGPDGFSRCHGLALTPDEREVWSVCGRVLSVHAGAAGFAELATVRLPAKGYWVTLSPDGSLGFVSLSGEGTVAVIDARRRRVVASLRAGKAPKRNLVLLDPAGSPTRALSSEATP